MDTYWEAGRVGKLAPGFASACKRGVHAIDTFRSDRAIRSVVDCVPADIGCAYWSALSAVFPSVATREYLERYCENDSVGSPPSLIRVGGVQIVPSTIKYAFRVWDLAHHFGPLDGVNVVEIGGGYGGLAAMVCRFFTPNSYTIYDLPEVCGLQRAYLSALGFGSMVEFSTQPCAPSGADLVVSDCALSELNSRGRSAFSSVLAVCERGSILWNTLCLPCVDLLDPDDAVKYLSRATKRPIVSATDLALFCGLVDILPTAMINLRYYWGVDRGCGIECADD